MGECTQCSTLRRQLVEERTRRLILEGQVRNLIWFINDQLDPDSKTEKIRPARRLVNVIKTRLEMALELGQGG